MGKNILMSNMENTLGISYCSLPEQIDEWLMHITLLKKYVLLQAHKRIPVKREVEYLDKLVEVSMQKKI